MASLQEKARTWAYGHGVGELMDATNAARLRTGMDGISTQCDQALYRVVRVEYAKRKTIVTPLSEWCGINATISFLESL